MKASGCIIDGKCGLGREGVQCEVGRLAEELSLPEPVRAESQRICAAVIERRLIRRRPLSVIAASSLYAASRDTQTPITLRELSRSSGSSSLEIGRCYRQIVSMMGLKPQPIDAALYAMKVAERAHVSEKAANLSAMMARKAVEGGLVGRNPMTLAAAAVYMACLMTGENRTQSDVAEAAGVGEISLRGCAKMIRRLVDVGSFHSNGVQAKSQ